MMKPCSDASLPRQPNNMPSGRLQCFERITFPANVMVMLVHAILVIYSARLSLSVGHLYFERGLIETWMNYSQELDFDMPTMAQTLLFCRKISPPTLCRSLTKATLHPSGKTAAPTQSHKVAGDANVNNLTTQLMEL